VFASDLLAGTLVVVPAELPAALAGLAARSRPHVLASDELLPVHPALTDLLGAPGLRRGVTIVVDGTGASGVTSLALALVAAASAAGAWVAAVDLPGLGLVAAGELGVALERVLLVPDSGARFGAVVGALLDATDVVLAGCPGRLDPALARRLMSRARERRAVLVVATGSCLLQESQRLQESRLQESRLHEPRRGSRASSLPLQGSWREGVDVRLEVPASRNGHGSELGRGELGWTGLGEGHGHLSARLVEVAAIRRRAAPQVVRLRLWLPSAEGGIALAAQTSPELVADTQPRVAVH